jgi:hypothetical protein
VDYRTVDEEAQEPVGLEFATQVPVPAVEPSQRDLGVSSDDDEVEAALLALVASSGVASLEDPGLCLVVEQPASTASVLEARLVSAWLEEVPVEVAVVDVQVVAPGACSTDPSMPVPGP